MEAGLGVLDKWFPPPKLQEVLVVSLLKRIILAWWHWYTIQHQLAMISHATGCKPSPSQFDQLPTVWGSLQVAARMSPRKLLQMCWPTLLLPRPSFDLPRCGSALTCKAREHAIHEARASAPWRPGMWLMPPDQSCQNSWYYQYTITIYYYYYCVYTNILYNNELLTDNRTHNYYCVMMRINHITANAAESRDDPGPGMRRAVSRLGNMLRGPMSFPRNRPRFRGSARGLAGRFFLPWKPADIWMWTTRGYGKHGGLLTTACRFPPFFWFVGSTI